MCNCAFMVVREREWKITLNVKVFDKWINIVFSWLQRVAMVLIAAAVCNKTGKAIISRQFVELTKSRIEVFEKRKLAQGQAVNSVFFLGPCGSLPKADDSRETAHICRDGQCPLCIPTPRQLVHAPHNHQGQLQCSNSYSSEKFQYGNLNFAFSGKQHFGRSWDSQALQQGHTRVL